MKTETDPTNPNHAKVAGWKACICEKDKLVKVRQIKK